MASAPMIFSWFRPKSSPPSSVLPAQRRGIAASQVDAQAEAVLELEQAFARDPTSVTTCSALGVALVNSGNLLGARAMFENATKLAPNSAAAHNNLGAILRDVGELEAAIASFNLAVRMDPRLRAAWDNLALTHFQLGNVESAVDAYKHLVALPGADALTQLALGNALMAAGDLTGAVKHYQRSIALDPECANARWALAMAQIRPFYDSAKGVERSRLAFSSAIESLEAWFTPQRTGMGVKAVGSTQPFYLAYHARDNLPLLKPYGRLCARLMQAGSTAPAAAPKRLPSGRKLRVGFASAQVRNHSVWIAIAKGWIQHLDPGRFEVHVFHLGAHSDGETVLARQEATDFVETAQSLEGWQETIAAAQLDVLIFPEIGMDTLTTQLAACRLAPVQATSWGHPHTTGLPTIDLFLSAEFLEPPLADAHYCERLIRLPNLGVCVAPLAPNAVSPDWMALGLPRDEPLLLCPGVPFKYRPEHDTVWATLGLRLQAHGAGRLVFFTSHRKNFSQQLERRLRRAFSTVGANYDQVVCMVPSLPRDHFYGLMQQATLMLDTIGFSGFNTAIQGLECGLPVIAHEGQFMRGRLASGLLRRMELDDWVAVSDLDFVDKAMRLVEDEAMRRAVRQQIVERRSVLFNDLAPVRALELALLEATARAQG